MLRLSVIFIICLLQFSAFAGNAKQAALQNLNAELTEEQQFFSAEERNVFHAGEKNSVRFIVRLVEKGNKKITENTAVIITHFHRYFFQRFNKLILSLRCESIPVFVLLRDFRI